MTGLGWPSEQRTPLRIAYIAMRWDYGDESRGLSFEEVNFRSALEGMGHDVLAYDFMERLRLLGRDAMNRDLVSFVFDLQPDLAFFFLFTSEIDPATIRTVTDSGIITINWFADDHSRFESYSRHFAPSFSHVVTTDADALAKYARCGYDGAILSQWGFNKYGYSPTGATSSSIDVSFIGQRYGDRPKIVRALRAAGVDVTCRGHGWEEGRATHAEMVDIFAASRINLNLAGAWAESRWRRRPPISPIKGRVFEVPGCGGFLLTERVPYLEDYFDIGGEIAVFDNGRDMIEKVQHWLANEDERRTVAFAGKRRVFAEHTYDHRFDRILVDIGLQRSPSNGPG